MTPQSPAPVAGMEAAIDALSEARDFIDRFSDVKDGDYGVPEPNDAMVMVHEINATIKQLSRPASEQPVEAIGAGREEALRRLTVLRDQARNGTPVTDPNEWEADELDAILAALSPASPARTPMGGEVEALREALERIADEAPYRSGYSQSDIEYGPKLSAEEMQTVARQALAASSPSPAQGGEQIARKAELYDHMREVAAANGFDSLTQAIAEAYAARQAVSASPQPEAGEEDPSHHQVWTQERGWEHPTPPSVQPVEGK